MLNPTRTAPVVRGARAALVCLLSLSLATACGTLSVEDEKKLGHQVQRQVRDQFTLMRDRVVVNYIRDLGEGLVSSARPSPFDFRFFVVEDPGLNAFAVPGGAIYINTGLISEADDVSELIGVVAHEMGHVTARHVAENYNRQRATGVVAQVLTLAIAILTGSSIGAQGGQVATGLAAQAYLATYTRDAEREADRLAIETMVRGGWDPNGMNRMFLKLMEQSAGGFRAPQLLSSHPATAERMENVNSEIAKYGELPRLRSTDGGRLEIIQKRIRLIVGTDEGSVEDDDN
jgi:predicted Zn-dependent protease